MSPGFLYVLINPSMPGLAKVGMTTRNPTNRVAELSSATGVASPFILAFQQPVSDCDSAEKWVHDELTRRGYRYAQNREFFSAPLHEVIPIVSQAANLSYQSENTSQSVSDANCGSGNLADELYEIATQYDDGSDTILKNRTRALQLYEQSAALGNRFACRMAAFIYLEGPDASGGPKKDREKALNYLHKAIQFGDWTANAAIAELFSDGGQPLAAQKSWHSFFSNACSKVKDFENYQGNSKEQCAQDLAAIGMYGWKYFRDVAMNKFEGTVPDEYILFNFEMINSFIEKHKLTMSRNGDSTPNFNILNELSLAQKYLIFIKNTTCSNLKESHQK